MEKKDNYIIEEKPANIRMVDFANQRIDRQEFWGGVTSLVVSLVCFGVIYLIFRGTNTPFFNEIGQGKELRWFFAIWAATSFLKVVEEAVWKNDIHISSFIHSMAKSFIISILSDMFIWLVVHCHGYNLRLLVCGIDVLAYTIVISFVRKIFQISSRNKKKRILIIGEQKECFELAAKFIKRGSKKDCVRIYFTDNDSFDETKVKEQIDKSNIIYCSKRLKDHYKNLVVSYTVGENKKIAYVVPNSFEVLMGQEEYDRIGDTLAIEAKPLRLSLFDRFIKRGFDIFNSLLALIVLSPLMGIIALAIHLQDGGPALFKQDRVTKDGRIFKLYKFRSMVVDAEKKTGAVLMTDNDQRLTKVGKIIRATRIDELPQLWNILKGDMSIIGPRPERPVFVEQFLKETPEYRYRLNVRAGLSGYAQVMGTYNTDYRDKLRWDLMYIRKYSFMLDIYLIIKTVLQTFDKDAAAGLEHLTDVEYLEQCGRRIEKYDDHWYIGPLEKQAMKVL